MPRPPLLALALLLASCGGSPTSDRKPTDEAPPADTDLVGDPDPLRPQAFGNTGSAATTVETRRHRMQLSVGAPVSTVQLESENYKVTLGLGPAVAPPGGAPR
jgi:hypothetical protein